MNDFQLFVVWPVLLFIGMCFLLGDRKIYAKLKHIRIFRIMGKIGGAEDFPNVRKKQKGVNTMTNGDRIRSMTDEELAAFLVSEDAQACAHCNFYDCETLHCTINDLCIVEGETDPARVMLLAWLSTETVSERSENSCSGCGYYDRDLGCGLNAPCPYD